jgi:hypothetical protein
MGVGQNGILPYSTPTLLRYTRRWDMAAVGADQRVPFFVSHT